MLNIKIIKSDITNLQVDVIVNAANKTLLGGSGVDGAIHKAAGERLLIECKKLNGCKVGQAKITSAYNMPIKKIIHTVGPIWKNGNFNESYYLSQCYINCLTLAKENHLSTIAFPAISTGVYRFPIHLACSIAINSILNFEDLDYFHTIYLVCFNDEVYNTYSSIRKKL